MNDVIAALIANGFILPAPVYEIQSYEQSTPLNPKVETNENEITEA